MRRLTSSVILVCVVVVATTVAQGRPNFAGYWFIDTHASTAPNLLEQAGNFNLIEKGIRLEPGPSLLIITQTDSTLTVEEHYVNRIGTVDLYPPNAVISYPLDGRAVTNKVVIRDTPRTLLIRPATVFTSRWKGDELVTTFTLAVPNEEAPRRYERTISLTSEDRLVVQLRMAGAPDAQTVIYQRKGGRL